MISQLGDVYGFKDKAVLDVISLIPREEFVPEQYKDCVYKDLALPIGMDQTISQPYTVAFMTHLLDIESGDRILEIGTGSGYQAAVLSKLAKEVYTIERIPELAKQAKKRLKKLGCRNVFVKIGQGEKGWKEKSPFDAILITAGVDNIPKALLDQLKEGGVLVAPVGKGAEKTMTELIKGKNNKIKKKEYGIFYFVPLIEKS